MDIWQRALTALIWKSVPLCLAMSSVAADMIFSRVAADLRVLVSARKRSWAAPTAPSRAARTLRTSFSISAATSRPDRIPINKRSPLYWAILASAESVSLQF